MTKDLRVARARRMRAFSQAQRSDWGRRMLRMKGTKHAHVTQLRNGHYMYMRLCRVLKKRLGRVLTPAERSHIRVTHAAEIAASAITHQ